MDQPNPLCTIFLVLISLVCSLNYVNTQPSEYPIAGVSTSWINQPHPSVLINSSDPVSTQPSLTSILLSRSMGNDSQFICGFYCGYADDTSCLFGVLIFQTSEFDRHFGIINKPKLVWSANRNDPVKFNATLQLTQKGDLILANANGSLVWSTDTAGKSVSGLKLTENGNLVLFDKNNATVWQSFDHPTDTLLRGQVLVPGQKLTASFSAQNFSQGLYSLAAERYYLNAFIESNPPQLYFDTSEIDYFTYFSFNNGTFDWFVNILTSGLAAPLTRQFWKLEPDGHLNIYGWGGSDWSVLTDLLSLGDCGYPMVCGRYGLCSNAQCGCPEEASNETSILRPIDYRQPNLGCSLLTPISCSYSQYHSLVELKNTSYFNFDVSQDNVSLPLQDCKMACLSNCSCKAVVFQYVYGDHNPSGGCLFLSEVFSLTNDPRTWRPVSVFVKVQKSTLGQNTSPASPSRKGSGNTTTIVAYSVGAFVGICLLVSIIFTLYRRKMVSDEMEELQLPQLSGMPTRFSYEDLRSITNDFSKKLGQGGFGSVFEGMLINGIKVAVKRLDGLGQIKKSFLAEVETIGNVHHVNLVRLIGYCAEKSYRLIVYEYMPNGSLDKWIFHKHEELTLGWELRKNIILDIAKGLAYLHEECRQKIFHFDIKPQNILLDENFSAKVADFGLAKLIDKDQSQVVTSLRGTPGYIAPEWLSLIITEKVDVYSFGIVVLEILCGRRNLDRSQLEEDMHLLGVFKQKAEQGQLLDLVDKNDEDMQLHGEEVVEIIKLAAWCLQGDFARRPSMTMVVKVLEGALDVDSNLDYNFTNPPIAMRTTPPLVSRTHLVLVLPPYCFPQPYQDQGKATRVF